MINYLVYTRGGYNFFLIFSRWSTSNASNALIKKLCVSNIYIHA